MKRLGIPIASILAGTVTGIFGAGGGLILVPILRRFGMSESQLFPSSVAIILPICLISLFCNGLYEPIPWKDALPFLIGSAGAGIITGLFGQRFSLRWLRFLLGLCLLWGGVRYLC